MAENQAQGVLGAEDLIGYLLKEPKIRQKVCLGLMAQAREYTQYKIDGKEVLRSTQIVSGVFNAMSIVTGQYYLSEINRDLTSIKAGVDDIKQEQKEQRKTNIEFVARLTAVEESTKQAHKRIDELRHE